MNFVVIGTDHRMQHSDPGLEGVLRSWAARRYIEPLKAIAEEHSDKIGESIGQRIAQERALHWCNIDMTNDEKQKAGILEEQHNRPSSQENVVLRVPSDEVRESYWIEKLTALGGTTLVICGYLHAESLVMKLRERGHAVDQRVYLEKVPEIRVWDGRYQAAPKQLA